MVHAINFGTMNTNWAKILLFSLIGSALGFLVCKVGFSGNNKCNGHSMCATASSYGHGEELGQYCCMRGRDVHSLNNEDHIEHSGDAKAERFVSDLEKVDFVGDTAMAIDGGKVRVVRSVDNLSVHVDMVGKESVEKEIEIEENH